MPQTKKVVLYGSSLFIAGLEASLAEIPNLEIECIEEQAGNGFDQMHKAAPDVIFLEIGITTESFTVTMLQKFPDVMLIGLDLDSDRLLVLSVQQQRALATADLVNVIWSQHSSRKE